MNVAILNAYNDRPISFNRHFVTIGCGITGALMLSQAVYWSSRTKDHDGWFYKTQVEWEQETGLTRREQESARKRLSELGVMQEERKGVPAQLYYKVDVMRVHELLILAIDMHDDKPCTKAPSQYGGMRQSSLHGSDNLLYTETTTETTTDGSGNSKELLEKSFEEFWSKYPKKISKQTAKRAWLRIKPAEDLLKTIMDSLANQKTSESWTKDNGKFIPHASTWLNGERWLDVLPQHDRNQTIDKPERGLWV